MVRYLAPITRQFNEFRTWWVGELIAWLPERFRRAILQRNQCVDIGIHAGEFVISGKSGTDNVEIKRFQRGNESDYELPAAVTDTRLVLPPEQVLTLQLTLPLATEENLHEALSFQMDRLTPFSVDQVYYDCQITNRDGSNQTLLVDLVVAPREYVDNVLDELNSAGLAPDRISVVDDISDELKSVNLLPAKQRKRRRPGLRRRRNLLLAGANLLLVAAVLATPIIQKQQLIRSLEPRLQQATEDARAGVELREEVAQLAATSEYLQDKKQSDPLVMRTMDEVTRLLPDNTWISRFDLSRGEIQIQGQSSASASLIRLLESSGLLKNVRFRSPVTRIGNTNEDRFHLSAEIIQVSQND